MTSINIVVHPPVESDAPRLAAIQISAWRAAYRGVMTDEYLAAMDSEHFANGWRRNIGNPKSGTFHLVVQAGREVIGFCILGPSSDESDGTSGQLYAINLHPDWWARGIGSVLFAAAEQKLVSLGYAKVFLWVEASNERAIGFYTKRGWLDDGGTLQDTRFDPPVAERRHSRELK